jgi:hypothetical protein
MKLQIKKRRLIPVAIAMTAVIAVSGVAYAYWTASGSGTGTGSAAAGVTVTVNQTTVLNPMYPGLAAQIISGNFTNATGAPVLVPSVTVGFDPVTPITGAPGTCDTTDFTLANKTATVGVQVPVGSPELTVTWTGPTIQFNDKAGVDQNGCKGATVHLVYSIP